MSCAGLMPHGVGSRQEKDFGMSITQAHEPAILLIETDFAELSRLAQDHSDTPVVRFLSHELDRARVVRQTDKKVVRLGSRVLYHDLSKPVATEITLVLPQDADVRNHFVSILTPIGAALIGLEEGQRISFSMPWTDLRTFAVIKVANHQVH
jgi:regulator of nucleoside diphosphate kinase